MSSPVNEPFQLFCSFSVVVVIIAFEFSFAYSPNNISVGLYLSMFSLSTNSLLIFIETYSFSTSSSVPGIFSPSCFASAFLIIIFSSLNGLIVTVNVIDFSSLPPKVTSIPSFNSASVYILFSNFMLFSTNVVPCGTISDILTIPSPSPLFFAVNVYVIWSISCNGVAKGVLILVVLIFTTPVFVSFVVFPFTIAAFFIVPSVDFTLTVNSTFSTFPGSTVTLQVNFFVFSSSLLSLSNNTVPSGMLS